MNTTWLTTRSIERENQLISTGNVNLLSSIIHWFIIKHNTLTLRGSIKIWNLLSTWKIWYFKYYLGFSSHKDNNVMLPSWIKDVFPKKNQQEMSNNAYGWRSIIFSVVMHCSSHQFYVHDEACMAGSSFCWQSSMVHTTVFHFQRWFEG